MAKKLDKTNNEQQNNSFLETPVETPDKLDDEYELDDDIDLEGSMDEEGNILDFEDDEPGETEPEDEEAEDSLDEDTDTDDDEVDLDEDEPEPPVKKGKKKLTPAEIKVINLKKENQKLQQDKERLEQQMQDKRSAQEKEKLESDFVAQGYDEDTAKNMAANEVRIKQIEQRQAILDFRDNNEEVFDRYPEAKKNVADIMQKSTASGLTAEQICLALYGQGQAKPREERAARAVRGESTRETGTDVVSEASRFGNRPEGESSLTAGQRKEKRMLERMFNNGDKMTDAEYLRHSKR